MSVEICLSPCVDARAKACTAFERQIDDGALSYLAPAIRPAQRNVHGEIEGKEALAALRRSPDHRETMARDQPFNQVVRCSRTFDVVEFFKPEACRCSLSPVGQRVDDREQLLDAATALDPVRNVALRRTCCPMF